MKNKTKAKIDKNNTTLKKNSKSKQDNIEVKFKVDAWCQIMKDYDFNKVTNTTLSHNTKVSNYE